MFRYKNSKINIKSVSPQFPTGKHVIHTCMSLLLVILMYLRAPWRIGYNQMDHPHKIKKLLTYLHVLTNLLT